jgi:hypothetical protein
VERNTIDEVKNRMLKERGWMEKTDIISQVKRGGK